MVAACGNQGDVEAADLRTVRAQTGTDAHHFDVVGGDENSDTGIDDAREVCLACCIVSRHLIRHSPA